MAPRDARRELEELDRVFSCLAHPSRRQVLLSLHLHGSMTAGEIASRFDCTWPTTSRHLKQLEDAGLVEVEAHGRERTYHVNTKLLARVAGEWLARFAR